MEKASVSKQLLSALDELVTDKQKRFKWHLKNHKGFLAADLENADASDTVDLMRKRFRPEEAVKIAVDILREMNYNHLAEELENKHKQARAEGTIEDPASVGVQSKAISEALRRRIKRKTEVYERVRAFSSSRKGIKLGFNSASEWRRRLFQSSFCLLWMN
ncbi:hypothetical protein Q8A67_012351 [Cirrhinus molitorella]|uniref:Pyrin domain-containing protein n=1 Tax=Cirrhinus molitorella TaxID=172907 RepID=A0AA88PUE9_9TELE|nr:hypothetical protein Q8A67_012351 [Cirrhinus molitorella]